MSGPGFVATGQCGEKYCPSYYVYPPFPPFQGMVLGPCPPGWYKPQPPCAPPANNAPGTHAGHSGQYQGNAVTDGQAAAELAMRHAAIASGAYPGPGRGQPQGGCYPGYCPAYYPWPGYAGAWTPPGHPAGMYPQAAGAGYPWSPAAQAGQYPSMGYPGSMYPGAQAGRYPSPPYAAGMNPGYGGPAGMYPPNPALAGMYPPSGYPGQPNPYAPGYGAPGQPGALIPGYMVPANGMGQQQVARGPFGMMPFPYPFAAQPALNPQAMGGPGYGGGGPGFGGGGQGAGGPGGPGGGQGITAVPTHLFARSPRDFFMIDVDPRARSGESYGLGSAAYRTAPPAELQPAENRVMPEPPPPGRP